MLSKKKFLRVRARSFSVTRLGAAKCCNSEYASNNQHYLFHKNILANVKPDPEGNLILSIRN
jgi:hypothetical protein